MHIHQSPAQASLSLSRMKGGGELPDGCAARPARHADLAPHPCPEVASRDPRAHCCLTWTMLLAHRPGLLYATAATLTSVPGRLGRQARVPSESGSRLSASRCLCRLWGSPEPGRTLCPPGMPRSPQLQRLLAIGTPRRPRTNLPILGGRGAGLLPGVGGPAAGPTQRPAAPGSGPQRGAALGQLGSSSGGRRMEVGGRGVATDD